MTPWQLRKTVRLVQLGGIIAYPTETVYGLGCDPLNARAVSRLLQIKHRSMHRGLILLAADTQQLYPFVDSLNPDKQAIIGGVLDQPTTWLVPKANATPVWITGEHDSVAVRITQHPLVRQLCIALGYPLVSTSANPSGRPVARNGLIVHRYFGDQIDVVLHGDLPHLIKPSRIKDLVSGRVLR